MPWIAGIYLTVGTAGADNYKCESQNCKLEYSASVGFFRWRLCNSITRVTAFMAQVVPWVLFHITCKVNWAAMGLQQISSLKCLSVKADKIKMKKNIYFQNTLNSFRIQLPTRRIWQIFLIPLFKGRICRKMQ